MTGSIFQIRLDGAGRRFGRDWVFRRVQLQLQQGSGYAITGPNGSGKSTLLQLIGGLLSPSEGTVHYHNGLPPRFSMAAPYLQLIEEMTAAEFLRFHFSFCPPLKNITVDDSLERVGLAKSAAKQVRYFSSGMKQRLKLAQAFFSDTPLLLLDEPCTNLDADGIRLYRELGREAARDRLLVVSSNDETEFGLCEHRLTMESFKR